MNCSTNFCKYVVNYVFFFFLFPSFLLMESLLPLFYSSQILFLKTAMYIDWSRAICDNKLLLNISSNLGRWWLFSAFYFS